MSNKQHYFWIQLINANPKSWTEELHRSNRISDAFFGYDHHLIKRNQIYYLDKYSSKLQISVNNSRTRSQLYFEDLFQNKGHLLETCIPFTTSSYCGYKPTYFSI